MIKQCLKKNCGGMIEQDLIMRSSHCVKCGEEYPDMLFVYLENLVIGYDRYKTGFKIPQNHPDPFLFDENLFLKLEKLELAFKAKGLWFPSTKGQELIKNN